MTLNLHDEQLHAILTPPHADEQEWYNDLERFEAGDETLTRRSAGEAAIKAVQRLMVFLGYSTSASGAFAIDGDFGRGTNRGVAQFAFEHGLTAGAVARDTLCYPCTWRTARHRITAIPDIPLTKQTLAAMLAEAKTAIATNQVVCGDFDEGLFHLNGLHQRRYLTCKAILSRYGALVHEAVQRFEQERGLHIQPAWVLAIIRQETAGIVRPRFEQHLLTKYNREHPQTDVAELRYRSMSFGLGQVLGVNYRRVDAPSARAMFSSSLAEQVMHVVRYLGSMRSTAVLQEQHPEERHFRTVAKAYNGPGYEKHHYHESLERWFREFRMLP